jgi:hypothetical protein
VNGWGISVLAMISNILKGGVAFGLGLTALSMMPAAYVEIGCRGDLVRQQAPRFIPNESWPLTERDSILSIPRHHMAFSYADMAEAAGQDAVHKFGFVESIRGYWGSLCAVLPVAETVLETKKSERLSLYGKGIAFSFDMSIKGVYEETIGRLTGLLSSDRDTQVGVFETQSYVEISEHLHDRPWWEFDWGNLSSTIYDLDIDDVLRDGERKNYLALLWKTKALAADLISEQLNDASEGVSLPEETDVHVSWISREDAQSVQGARVREATGRGLIVTLPRDSRFTSGIVELIDKGALISEISGADDVMLTVLSEAKPITPDGSTVLSTLERPGFERDRFVLRARTRSLAKLIEALEEGGDEVEMFIDF